jgi:hypothetical protein
MKGKPVPGAWQPPADVFIDTIPGLLHHKYFLVDADTTGEKRILVTGSYNWETPAETGNDENMLVIYDARINNLYFQEFMARYRESGGITIGMGFETAGGPASPGCSLEQNYPNPFYRVTNIKYTVSAACNVKIVVCDMLGKEVRVVVDERVSQGTHQTLFDSGSLPGGIYVCTISAGNYSVTKKMIHL